MGTSSGKNNKGREKGEYCLRMRTETYFFDSNSSAASFILPIGKIGVVCLRL